MTGDRLTAEAERLANRQRLEAFLTTRAVSQELTADSLRTGIRLQTIVDAAGAVAEFVDQALEIVHDQYKPRLACTVGCSYCCRKPGVLVSLPEFIRVLVHVRAELSDDERAALRARAAEYVALLDGQSFDAPTTASIPCPLLVDGRCSVYDIRPFVCRGYNSIDVEACRRAHDDAAALVPVFSILKDCANGAAIGVVHQLVEQGRHAAMIDLGTALHIVLATEGGAEAILEDPTVLTPAENPTWARDLWARVQDTARHCGVTP